MNFFASSLIVPGTGTTRVTRAVPSGSSVQVSVCGTGVEGASCAHAAVRPTNRMVVVVVAIIIRRALLYLSRPIIFSPCACFFWLRGGGGHNAEPCRTKPACRPDGESRRQRPLLLKLLAEVGELLLQIRQFVAKVGDLLFQARQALSLGGAA